MAFYLVTGKLGSGKSLITVAKMAEYLNEGRMVATNLDLNPQHMVNPWAKKTRIIRVPDKPTILDFKMLPVPYEGDYDEEKTGLLVLDECGTWFNSRDYRDKTRGEVINYLLHIRKMGWDVMLIVQNISMIDSQVREGMGEQIVYCSRFDKISIPLLGPILKFFDLPYKAPKMHQALVKYGTSHNSPVVDRWVFFGTHLFEAYDTRQIFGANQTGVASVLPPYYQYGRYIGKSDHAKRNIINTTIRSYNAIQKSKWFFFTFGIIFLLTWQWYFKDEPVPLEKTVTNSETIAKNTSGELEELEKIVNQTDVNNFFISGSVWSTRGYFFSFQNKQGDVVYPDELGYVVRGLSECSAQLISNKEIKIVKCRGVSASRDAIPSRLETSNSL
jgi:hypothetical protein